MAAIPAAEISSLEAPPANIVIPGVDDGATFAACEGRLGSRKAGTRTTTTCQLGGQLGVTGDGYLEGSAFEVFLIRSGGVGVSNLNDSAKCLSSAKCAARSALVKARIWSSFWGANGESAICSRLNLSRVCWEICALG